MTYSKKILLTLIIGIIIGSFVSVMTLAGVLLKDNKEVKEEVKKDSNIEEDYKYETGYDQHSNKEGRSEQAGNTPSGMEDDEHMGRAESCRISPGQYIRFLLQNHNKFDYSVNFDDDKRTVNWRVTSNDKDALRLLAEHIECMGDIMKSGSTPRKWDPVFVLEAKINRDRLVTTKVEYNEKESYVAINKTAADQCSYLVIKAHAKVVKGFFETGRQEASKKHDLTPEIEQACARYL